MLLVLSKLESKMPNRGDATSLNSYSTLIEYYDFTYTPMYAVFLCVTKEAQWFTNIIQ